MEWHANYRGGAFLTPYTCVHRAVQALFVGLEIHQLPDGSPQATNLHQLVAEAFDVPRRRADTARAARLPDHLTAQKALNPPLLC